MIAGLSGWEVFVRADFRLWKWISESVSVLPDCWCLPLMALRDIQRCRREGPINICVDKSSIEKNEMSAYQVRYLSRTSTISVSRICVLGLGRATVPESVVRWCHDVTLLTSSPVAGF
jgi:hypothetical protein